MSERKTGQPGLATQGEGRRMARTLWIDCSTRDWLPWLSEWAPSMSGLDLTQRRGDADVLLLVLDHFAGRLHVRPVSGSRIVLWSTKGDFSDDELKAYRIAAYAGPGSPREDVVRCLCAVAEGDSLILRDHLPERWSLLTQPQREVVRRILSGETIEEMAANLGVNVDAIHSRIGRAYVRLPLAEHNHRALRNLYLPPWAQS